jgi:large subunit ribosomal protein L9
LETIMAMEVLLRRSIEGVGSVGEVVRVKNGYARNYLLPQGLAAMVSAESLRRVEQDRKDEAVREAHLAEERAALAKQLEDVTLTIEARAGEDGHLYGSVGVRQVIAAFQELDHRFVERQIRFETVRELGEYEVQLLLSKDLILPIKVWVVQDAMEAREMAEAAAARAAEEAERPAAPDVPMPEGDLLDAE